MVRNYERVPGSRTYRDFTEENLEDALEAVRAGMSKKMAAQTYGISRATIARKLLGRNMQQVGHPKVLSSQEEASIAETLGVVANWGFPLTRLDVRTVIAKYLEK
ncbi:hypothetical protein NQ314_007189 [Rhamnusium bicolor]|uniref:HTH psq-type domain-containing protein n=1 Tax=Rhamnusium bicolor TaxID=1586634 RepID=A0AAV8YT97_9CUCU|nr:hypothetical protein NQ314_007189 [Rhamnusium bicolor]